VIWKIPSRSDQRPPSARTAQSLALACIVSSERDIRGRRVKHPTPADIPVKLRMVGCDIAPLREPDAKDFTFTDAEVETLGADADATADNRRLRQPRKVKLQRSVDGLYPTVASAIGHFAACGHGRPRVDHAAEISCRIGYFGDREPNTISVGSQILCPLALH
jgi:hypothetical protein